ncbi:MAG: hypothetical protein C5B55_03420 [Blastocatellia bacterium]|nr:MAG: hypothetical protein C5B55_03420 [Blastocatellia bacterium]
MHDEVNAHGARFVVATLSKPEQVIPNAHQSSSFMSQIGVSTLFYPDERIKALGTKEGFEVITLAPEMQKYAQANKVFLHGFGSNIGNGHWNENGHRVASDLLAESICSNGLLK